MKEIKIIMISDDNRASKSTKIAKNLAKNDENPTIENPTNHFWITHPTR